MSAQSLDQLQLKANTIRQNIVKMIAEAGSGHPAGSLGMAEVFTVLYFQILKHDPKNPTWEDRDRLVLSPGHICPALYAAMAQAGYFPTEELITLRKLGSRLQGHPHRQSLPGIETTSGPLGSGLSQACGMALVAKMDKLSWHTYCLMSDGEQDEGNTWEAVMLAAKYKLDNLTALIDRNKIQLSGPTEEILPLEPLKEKYQAFGWHVLEVDGHDFKALVDVFEQAKSVKDKPTVIIAQTIPGKGVDFMENKSEWHGKAPDTKEAEKALDQLKMYG